LPTSLGGILTFPAWQLSLYLNSRVLLTVDVSNTRY
jgi:hypothetical protein